jgi:soluble lytic murein transglycosylase
MINLRAYALASIMLLIVAALACSYTPPNKSTPASDTSLPGTPTALSTRVVIVATDTATPRPTSTPTPTATATPTPLPAVRLTRADHAMFNGDYDTATEEYTAILSGTASADEIHAAQFGAAKARFLAGDPGAADALQTFATSSPGDSHEAEAWFLLGQAQMDAGDYASAIEAYQRYLKLRGDVIAPYINLRIGDAQRADNKPEAAAETYRTALANAPPALAFDLREKLAAALLDAGDTTGALAQYDTVLAASQYLSYRLRIQTLAVQALDAAGQTQSAHQRRQLIVNEYTVVATSQLVCPSYSSYAYDVLVTLVGDNVPVDEFKRGLVDYCARQYDPALAAFTRSIQAGNRVAESRYWAGLAFRAQGETDDALREFNLIIQNFPSATVWGQAWMEKAKTLSATGSYTDAVSVYQEFATKYPGRSEAPEALWRAGVTAFTSHDDKTALDTWQMLTSAYPASDWSAPAALWQGKLAQASGQTVTATMFFSQAAAFNPATYYSVRAAELLRGESTPLQPVSATLTFGESAQRATAEEWLAARLNITDTAQLRGLRRDLAFDLALVRGMELNRIGLQTEADDEFDSARAVHQGDAVALYQLAILFRDLGAYRQSIAAANALLSTLSVRVTDAPPFLARLVYPTYYADLVVPEAQSRGLDPLLVFALLRQESLFESLSYSSAAAHGLMQIIPATGQEIATVLQWPGYSRADLYKPYVSIKFGIYYLARQRDGLDGDLYAALAAYNGGPGNAVHWKAESGDDPDLFYETVSFSETQLYIRRISEYYEVYKKLYATR